MKCGVQLFFRPMKRGVNEDGGSNGDGRELDFC